MSVSNVNLDDKLSVRLLYDVDLIATSGLRGEITLTPAFSGWVTSITEKFQRYWKRVESIKDASLSSSLLLEFILCQVSTKTRDIKNNGEPFKL